MRVSTGGNPQLGIGGTKRTPLPPSTRAYDASAINPLRERWELGKAFIVGYSGNMGRAHRLDELIDAASALRSQPSLRFVLIGDGAQRAGLEARARSLGLQNVMFQPYQPREGLLESLSLPDIHIVSLDERLEGLIVPSKFVGAIAAGRPILWIGGADGEVGGLIKDSGCGVSVPAGDIAALTQALRELSEDHSQRRRAATDHGAPSPSSLEHTISQERCPGGLGAHDRTLRTARAMTFVIHIAACFSVSQFTDSPRHNVEPLLVSVQIRSPRDA